MEDQILQTIRTSIQDAIVKTLVGYNSPLEKLVNEVVQKNAPEISKRMDDALKASIQSHDFDAAMRDAMGHKLARQLISKMDGAVEKVANDLRSNPTFRAKLTLLVEETVRTWGEAKALAK